jgi:hypothetical protein
VLTEREDGTYASDRYGVYAEVQVARREAAVIVYCTDVIRALQFGMGVSLTIRLDEETAMVLEREVRRTRRSKGRIVRDAIVTYVRVEKPSALDAFAKYVGTIDGPADLSTNKRYLKTLGRPRRSR